MTAVRCLLLQVTGPALMYLWPGGRRGQPYLGAAHGLMGILYALMHCDSAMNAPSVKADVQQCAR